MKNQDFQAIFTVMRRQQIGQGAFTRPAYASDANNHTQRISKSWAKVRILALLPGITLEFYVFVESLQFNSSSPMEKMLATTGKTLMYAAGGLTALFAMFDWEILGTGVHITGFYYVFMAAVFGIGLVVYRNRQAWAKFLS